MSDIKYEKNESPGSHEIISDNVMVCAETGRVVAVFYNDYDLDIVIDKLRDGEEAENRLDQIRMDGDC